MSSFKLQTRLYFVIAFLLVVALTIGVSASWNSYLIRSEYQNLTAVTIPKSDKLHSLYSSFLRIRMNLRNLGLPGIAEKEAHESLDIVQKSLDEVKRLQGEYEALGFEPGQKELYEKQVQAWKDFVAVGTRVIEQYNAHTEEGRQEMTHIFFGDCPKAAGKLVAATEDLFGFHEARIAEKSANAEAIASRGNISSTLILCLGIFVGLALGYFFTRSLARSLNKISTGISTAGEQTAQDADLLTSASGQLSQASTEAAASLEETVASIEELTSMVKLNSDNAQQANMLSQKSRESALLGEKEIMRLIHAMREIAEGSKKIEEIIQVIDDIAFQTNLLALNASVEAARAGEQGKGFAVVAEAVRTLAQRSAVAAKDIALLIKDNVLKSEHGSEVAQVSNQVLSDILTSIKKVADLNSEIASGSQEQSKGLQQISQAMNQLDQSTQGNAASSSQIAYSAKAMLEQSVGLNDLVAELYLLVEGKKVASELHAQKEAS